MGIELNFNPGSPHIFRAPQSLTYTEQAGQLTGSPSLDLTELAWNDDITVTAQNVNPSVDSAIGSLSTLHLQPSDSSILGDVATRKVTVTIDGGGGGGQSANRVTGLHARAEMTTAGDGTTITSLAAIRAGVNVTSAGAGSITELSAIEIEAPTVTAFPASVVGLRIKDHGAANYAIRTGTGQCLFGGACSFTTGVYTNLVNNTSSGNNATIQPLSTGTLIQRNIADANPALIVNQQNASSTGRIVNFAFNGATVLSVGAQGAIYTASGNESTGAGTAALGTNSPATVLTAPYRWIRFITSDGTPVFIPAWK